MFHTNLTRRRALHLAGLTAATASAAIAAGCGQEESPQTDDRVQAILGAMTLEQKVAQMMMPHFRYETYTSDEDNVPLTTLPSGVAESISAHAFGGVVLYAQNVQGNEQVTRLIDAMQQANAADEAHGRVPLLVAADQEGGNVARLTHGTRLTGAMALGACPSLDDTKTSACIIGSELAALGFTVDFAPDADVNSNPANPIIGIRSFSDDAQKVADHVATYIDGLHEQGIIATAKHFPGHGDTSVDSHTGLPLLEKTLDELKQVDLVPFKQAIASGADMIMTAHIQFPNVEAEPYTAKDGSSITLPATLSKAIIGDLLRDDLGYQGVICTDSLTMDAIAKYLKPEDVATLAINAGVDLLVIPVDDEQPTNRYLSKLDDYVTMVAGLVKGGAVDEALVDAAVTRILTMKRDRGILDLTFSDAALEQRVIDALATVGSEEHHQQEHEIAQRAVTLVKNDDVFPVGGGLKTLILVPYESQLNSANYADRLAAENGIFVDGQSTRVLYFGEAQPDAFDQEFADAVRAADVTIGVSAMYDMSDLSGTQAAILDKVIATCKEAGKKSVIISAQLPYDLPRFWDADALLACYYATGVRELPEAFDGETPAWAPNLVAAIGIALGDGKPEGKLPVNVPELVKVGEEYDFSSAIFLERGSGLEL